MRKWQKQKMGTKPIEKLPAYYTNEFNELKLRLANSNATPYFLVCYCNLYSFWLYQYKNKLFLIIIKAP